MISRRWVVVAGAVLLCTSVLVAGVTVMKTPDKLAIKAEPVKALSLKDAASVTTGSTGVGNVEKASQAVEPVPAGAPNATRAPVPQATANLAVVAEQVEGKFVTTNTGEEVPYVMSKSSGVTIVAGSREIVFDLTPGTSAPPDSLCGYLTDAFPLDERPLYEDVTSVPSPCPYGDITFDIPVNHRRIGSGWATWSHDYTGDVYYTNGSATLTITLPQPQCAFYFYVEPNPFEEIEFTATANDGTQVTFTANGSAGATYVGVCGTDLQWVTVATTDGVTDFAVGEFGQACFCEPVFVACCDEATGTCVDSVDLMECINQGGRYEVGIEFCADLDPPCGTIVGACCESATPDPGYDPYQCIGDMTAAECLAIGEETSWHPDQSCAGTPPYDCGAPTYCDVSYTNCGDRCECVSGGAPDDWIMNVTFADLNNDTCSEPCPDSYGDYTDLVAHVALGVTYNLSVTFCSEGTWTECVTVWIDWNNDKVFDNDTERYDLGCDVDATLTMDITVPPTAIPGFTRMRVIEEYANPPVDACTGATYGETEDYTIEISGEMPTGACCDPYTGECTDNVEAIDCTAPLVFYYQQQCAELDPPCGNPGACCDDATAECTETLELLCDGRFVGGATCAEDPFDPPCGQAHLCDILYAPTEEDNPTFRAEVAALTVSDCDYYDARVATPTLDELLAYETVMTWVNYAYADSVGMGNVLADYVEAGGRVILGQWCEYSGQVNWLEGRIIDEYSPADVDMVSFSTDSYAGDGYTCAHVGVTDYASDYRDHIATLLHGALEDGHYTDGSITLAYLPSMQVWYAAGHTGGTYGTGQWAQLTANICFCTPEPMYGACCDPATGECTDNVELMDCLPLQFFWNEQCAELDPPCGNPGACCDDATGQCTDTFEVLCDGRFVGGVTCADDPFDPPCGQAHLCDILYAPTEEDNPTFRAEVAALTVSDCDYYDARVATPTLDELLAYETVMTWVNYAYADSVGMGDVLADYVEAGGRVILGQWCEYSGQVNWLEGRIIDEYSPADVDMVSFSTDSYAGDGYTCAHVGVTDYASDYRDHIATLLHGALEDGHYTDGSITLAYLPTMQVWYAAGHTGGTYGTGQWAQLTANICFCTPEPMYGACCDPATGECTDNVELMDCLPLQFFYNEQCAELTPPCGNPGACCDIYTGECVDNVLELNCPPGSRFEPGGQCAELEPPCGTPGACCDDETATCVETFEALCDGRFIAGATCDPDPFDPPCGEWTCVGLLYAPSQPDNSVWRAEVSAITGQPVDYWDARASTPTMEDLQDYCCVFTWVNYAYFDNVAMGDVLADFVDANGKVILGQWCLPTAGNYLDGRIMTEGYCPVTGTTYSAGDYAGDGTDCVWVGVTTLSSSYRDQCTLRAGMMSDGTFTDGWLAAAWRPDRKVYYSPGNTGGDYTDGETAQLVANMCLCAGAEAFGACCDPYTGECTDDVAFADCPPTSNFYLDTACAELDPPCGNPGACCDDSTATCVETFEILCDGRFLPGATCDPDPFDPPCGEYTACQHSITMWDSYGDGWNGSNIDVYVNGVMIFQGLTLESGAGPETVYFDAATGDEITTVYHCVSWCAEPEYCIYDVFGNELGCDGQGGVEPTGITVYGFCGEPGACCDPFTGECTDGVEYTDCAPPMQFFSGEQCAELDPPCGNPGACCDDSTATCVETLEALCDGRFIAGATCDPDPFDPPCGEYTACQHSITMWDSYGDGWNGSNIDVYVNGVMIFQGLTLESGAGPETVYFDAATGDEITTVYHCVSWCAEPEYCIYDGLGNELGCDGQGGVEPTGITVYGSCEEAVCGDGICQTGAGEDCCTCPEDCGEYGCLSQPPNQSNGIFSDLDCGACGTGIQILAENFRVCDGAEIEIDALHFFGGYWPDNLVTDPDQFVVVFREDAGGVPGAEIVSFGPMAATTKATTGVVLFGVDEYEYTIDLDPNVVLGGGSYFVEIYNNTSDTTDQWFWEVGDLDTCAGIMGQAYTFTLPEEPWSYDGATDMALDIICVTGFWCDLNHDGAVDGDDYTAFLLAFGSTPGDPNWLPEADWDGDEVISLVDWQAFRLCYLEANPPARKGGDFVK